MERQLTLLILSSAVMASRVSNLIDKRIKLSIVSGFLGSGKTTFLQHYINKNSHDQLCIIVNEVGDIPVDDLLLGKKVEKYIITGGCICCDKNDQFLQQLIQICDTRTVQSVSGNQQLETIIVETSGISDPASIYESIMNHPIVGRNITFDGITVLLDALDDNNFITQALIAKQLVCADNIYISKTDLASTASLLRTYKVAKHFNPTAIIKTCEKGVLKNLNAEEMQDNDFDLVLPDVQIDNGNKFETFVIQLSEKTDWNTLVVWMSALLSCHGKRIMRLKGVVNSPAGKLLIQGVGSNIQKPQILPKSFANKKCFLVLIGVDFKEVDVQQSMRYLN